MHNIDIFKFWPDWATDELTALEHLNITTLYIMGMTCWLSGERLLPFGLLVCNVYRIWPPMAQNGI